ncbi:glycosyltransferase [Ideonella azotifigens]|nr:glycosyltransferase [Ideonella azotifigens]
MSPASQPRVLVLLAARNGASSIERQIGTVLAQSGVAVRVLVRDDGSSDDTRDRVRAFGERDPRVALLDEHSPSGSAGANFFRLVAAADPGEADLVAFCDQDDEWFHDKLQRAAQALSRAGADGYSAATLARWPDGRERPLVQNLRARAADYLFEGAGQGCTFVATVSLFARLRAAITQAPDLLPTLHYHDWVLYALARSAGLRWVIDPWLSMVYHQHSANDTGARSSLGGVSRRIAQIRSGWYRAQVDAVTAFVLRAHPGDVQAMRWRTLRRPGLFAAWRRLGFVLCHGRRRPLDRLIQALAVVAGRL